MEKKLNAQTDWAELVRQQQHYAEQMIQQEKDRKNQQRNELNEALSGLVKDKETSRKLNATNEKQEDYNHSMTRKHEYDQYLENRKLNKIDNQRNLADYYSQQQRFREEELKKKNAQEKQIEEKMLSDALDSLQRENALKEKRRAEFIQSLVPLQQEKEAQKKREQDKIRQDKEEQKRLMDERAKNLEMQENNYKMYFQRVHENQTSLQQMYDQRIRLSQKSKDTRVDDLIGKGIEEARKKAEQEELARQQKKQEQLKSMKESIQFKIQEHEEANARQKLNYKDKVDELMKQNQQIQEWNEQQKIERTRQALDYKNYLQSQIKETEKQRRHYNSSMLEQEKKLHSNFDGLVPGIRSSKIGNQISAHMKSAKNLSMLSPEATSPYTNSPYTGRSIQTDNIPSTQSVRNSSYNPFNTINHDRYNPITNPIPNTVQNPYIRKELPRSEYQPKNTLASVSSNNLLI